tara:strand:- start:93599 stop:94984 length:1386 start_codon:yes stop_codon:yes gene_type:complete
MLLPANDSVGGAISFKVFQDVENFLKSSEWCYYKSNSEILNIFANYKKNINSMLENDKVLKVVSEKTNSGSLIKIDIVNQMKGVEVELKIIGANGSDLLFKEKTRLTTDEPTLISQTVKNWLTKYESSIPYDARIIGVLGNQFTVDMGTEGGIFPNSEVVILRPTRKRRHPLLKEIVDWETEKIGSGKIIFSNKKQAQGNMLQYDTRKKLAANDWVLVSQKDKNSVVKNINYEEGEKYKFGKVGTISFKLGIGKGSTTNTQTTTRKIGGTLFDLDLRGLIWITRNYWTELELGKGIGSYSKKEGTITNSSYSISQSDFKVKVGYKYLPLGFFYGPQVDGYVGYASKTNGLDTNTSDGFTETSFKGILLGAKGSLPIQNLIRVYLDFSFMFSPGYGEETQIYGEADSTSNYEIEIGGNYLYSPNMTIDGALNFDNSSAKFIGPVRSYKVNGTALKVGATFTF